MRNRAPKLCCEAGCFAKRFCYGRCKPHFAALDAATKERFQRLQDLSIAEREAVYRNAGQPQIITFAKWEYLGDEDTLAAMTAAAAQSPKKARRQTL